MLTAAAAAGLGLGLDWLGRQTPPEGETLVTAAEQEVLAAMRAEFKLVYSDADSLHFAVM